MYCGGELSFVPLWTRDRVECSCTDKLTHLLTPLLQCCHNAQLLRCHSTITSTFEKIPLFNLYCITWGISQVIVIRTQKLHELPRFCSVLHVNSTISDAKLVTSEVYDFFVKLSRYCTTWAPLRRTRNQPILKHSHGASREEHCQLLQSKCFWTEKMQMHAVIYLYLLPNAAFLSVGSSNT